MNRREMMQTSALAAVGAGLAPALPAFAAAHAAALPVAQRFTIGDLTVTALSDGYLPIEPGVMNGIEADEFNEFAAQAYRAPGPVATGVNAFLVDDGSELTLVDAGTGSIMGPTLGQLFAQLEAVGVAPDAVTRVIATHLHPDHIGGVVSGGTNPFTNAALVVAQAEVDFWTNADIKAGAPEEVQGFFDLAGGAVTAFGDRLTTVEDNADLGGGMTAMLMPGHTPGHMGVMLDSSDTQLLIWGDIVHVGPVQFARPEVTIAFDTDAEMAAATRARVFDMAATDRVMVAGAHISFPGFGYVERAGEAFAWVPAPFQYG